MNKRILFLSVGVIILAIGLFLGSGVLFKGSFLPNEKPMILGQSKNVLEGQTQTSRTSDRFPITFQKMDPSIDLSASPLTNGILLKWTNKTSFSKYESATSKFVIYRKSLRDNISPTEELISKQNVDDGINPYTAIDNTVNASTPYSYVVRIEDNGKTVAISNEIKMAVTNEKIFLYERYTTSNSVDLEWIVPELAQVETYPIQYVVYRSSNVLPDILAISEIAKNVAKTNSGTEHRGYSLTMRTFTDHVGKYENKLDYYFVAKIDYESKKVLGLSNFIKVLTIGSGLNSTATLKNNMTVLRWYNLKPDLQKKIDHYIIYKGTNDFYDQNKIGIVSSNTSKIADNGWQYSVNNSNYDAYFVLGISTAGEIIQKSNIAVSE